LGGGCGGRGVRRVAAGGLWADAARAEETGTETGTGGAGLPRAGLARGRPAPHVKRGDDSKVKIDPELQKRIDELLDGNKAKKPTPLPKRRGMSPARPPASARGARKGATRPGAPKTKPRTPPTRPAPRNTTGSRNTSPRPGARNTPGARGAPEATSATTSLNIPPSDDNVAPEERTYRFGIKDGTYEQLVEGFARQTGLGVVGDAPRDGRVTFVTTEELSFNDAL